MKIKETNKTNAYTPREITITVESQEEENTLKSFGNLCGYELKQLIDNNKKINPNAITSKLDTSLTTCTVFLNKLYSSL